MGVFLLFPLIIMEKIGEEFLRMSARHRIQCFWQLLWLCSLFYFSILWFSGFATFYCLWHHISLVLQKFSTHNVWKLLKISHLNFSILAFSTNFCPIWIDLSGYTVWQQASGFQKLAKLTIFWHFWWTFVLSKM